MAMLPILVPAEASIGLDSRVLGFALVLSLVSGVAFGLTPAIATLRSSGAASIAFGHRATATASHRRIRGTLIVVEVALAFVLMANAGLLIRSFLKMRQADTGFDGTNVLTAEIPVREHRFADAGQLHAFMHQVLTSIQALPGVSDVAFTDSMPMQGTPTGTFFQIASRPVIERAQRPVSNLKIVSPAYFRALGLRLRRGRALSDVDSEGAPLAAVINETLARMYFAKEDPVGQSLLMDRPGFGSVYSGEASSFEIVGVIADERLMPFDDKRELAAAYVSNEQVPRGFAGVVMRASFEPSRMERELRQAMSAVDKDQPITDVKTVDRLKSESMLPDRLRSALLGLFAAIALGLSAIGIYGVISYSVVLRTREIGIRAALGARPANLIAQVVGRGMALTATGLALGCVAAFGLSRLLRSFLFGVGSADATAWIASIGVLAGVAAIGCYLPARKAAQVDPLDALRAE
jgi:putative ABC transport system permease protein